MFTSVGATLACTVRLGGEAHGVAESDPFVAERRRSAAARCSAPLAVRRAKPSRRNAAAAPWLVAVLREAGTLLALFGLWQLVGQLSLMSTDHALRSGRVDPPDGAGASACRTRRPGSGRSPPYPVLVRLANYYYASMHFAAMIALLVWVFLRHRAVRVGADHRGAGDGGLPADPVHPGRAAPHAADSGFVDVAAEYGQSVYTAGFGGLRADELSAMPSVHVAWCVLVAVAVIRVARSPWRWLILLHPGADHRRRRGDGQPLLGRRSGGRLAAAARVRRAGTAGARAGARPRPPGVRRPRQQPRENEPAEPAGGRRRWAAPRQRCRPPNFVLSQVVTSPAVPRVPSRCWSGPPWPSTN